MEYIWVVAFVAGLIAGSFLLGARQKLIVHENHVGLLYRNGKFERTLAPGLHRWLDFARSTSSVIVPTMPLAETAVSSEAMSSDRFAFRLHIAPVIRITDARVQYESIPKDGQPFAIYGRFPLLATAIHSLIGERFSERTIEQIVASPTAVLAGLEEKLAPFVPGAVVEQLLVTGLTLPPEIRKMFTEVERARHEGLASLERARGEQAALRALANAARSLENNPGLAQLRLIQTMEGAKGQKSFVLGSAGLTIEPGNGGKAKEKKSNA